MPEQAGFRPGKCAFHLRNPEAKRELNVVWNGTRLSNTTPVYLGAHLDRHMCYKTHIEKTMMNVNARNNIIRKLANSKRGCKTSTLRPSCLAICYSAAEYACPVWTRSTHARKLNPCPTRLRRIISDCLKPTNLDSFTCYFLFTYYFVLSLKNKYTIPYHTIPYHTYWPVSPLLTSGGPLPAARKAHDKRQTQDNNCSITDQLLAD